MKMISTVLSISAVTALAGLSIYQYHSHQKTQQELTEKVNMLETMLVEQSKQPVTAVPISSSQNQANNLAVNQSTQSNIQNNQVQPRQIASLDKKTIESHNKRVNELAQQGKNPDLLFQKRKQGDVDL